ncbi:hypothetical protein ACYZUD_07730 [Pseudomonas sp. XS1P51]
MLKSPARLLLLSLSLACFPLMGNAATSSAANTAKAASQPFSVSCTSGNFKGEATGHYYNYGSSKSIYLKYYRITKSNDQQGGNKANVNLGAFNASGSGSKQVKSPDSMKQDGQWHSQDLSITYAPWSSTQIQVEFVFDKSGSDPKCIGRANI